MRDPRCLILSNGILQSSRGAEHVLDLVQDHLLDLFACHGEVSSRVEDLRALLQDAADAGRHGETDVGVYVDLADREASRLAEHLLGNALSAGKVAAAAIDEYLAGK